MKTNLTTRAFTLIELLVVISIVAILAGIATPIYTSAIMNGQQAEAINNVRQIGLGLRMLAGDNNGVFPRGKNSYDETITKSNDAFRSLVPTYIDNEKVFAVSRSIAGPAADNHIGTPAEILAAGENHWAYIEGLTTSSNSNWPLIVDSTDGSGIYTDVEGDAGGTWKGTKAVMLRVDGGAVLPRLKGTSPGKFIPRHDDDTKNALALDEYMGATPRLLEPVTP